MREKIIKYRGRAIVIGFNPERCTHAAECLNGLPDVFDNTRKPWVDPDAAAADDVARVIQRCPTGALHFWRKDGGREESAPDRNTITVVENGPFYFSGKIRVVSPGGDAILQDTRLGLCRCGQSKNKLWCDGKHFFAGFHDPGRIACDRIRMEAAPAEPGPLVVTPLPDGPFRIAGPFILRSERFGTECRGTGALLCRCGASRAKPFCDGTHVKIHFRTEPTTP